jgi:hypothetical protein
VELRGFEPLTSCMPSRDPRHGPPHGTPPDRTAPQVRCQVTDRVVQWRAVLCGAVSGKSPGRRPRTRSLTWRKSGLQVGAARTGQDWQGNSTHVPPCPNDLRPFVAGPYIGVVGEGRPRPGSLGLARPAGDGFSRSPAHPLPGPAPACRSRTQREGAVRRPPVGTVQQPLLSGGRTWRPARSRRAGHPYRDRAATTGRTG